MTISVFERQTYLMRMFTLEKEKKLSISEL